MMFKSGHQDHFCREHLPPQSQWPEFRLAEAGLSYPERMNVAVDFIDRHVAEGRGHRIALIGDGVEWTYAQLQEKVNRIANVLTRDLGLVPGHRVLLRSPNNPMMTAIYFAIIKAGGVVVATMPLLRAKEIAYPLNKAQIALAICDHRMMEEMEAAKALAPGLSRIVAFGNGELEGLMAKNGYEAFTAVDTAQDDVCLIAFTSGTTGEPKGTMHFQRDLLAICDTFGGRVLCASADDRFIGSPPLAFTFGLGGLVLFPLRIGAAGILIEKAGPPDLFAAIHRYGATVTFTAPTAYRAMLEEVRKNGAGKLRICVSAGENLPKSTYLAWQEATGIALLDGLGATEMLHIFIGSRAGENKPGATGRVVPGYEARIIDENGNEVPDGTPGRLAMRGPTGCRYLSDDRQGKYVLNGWNVSGDTYVRDADGFFWYQARSDDMIISAGYNIAGPEVEASLLNHEAVAECGVVGAPDPERGMIVKAYVVLKGGYQADAALLKTLQDHVKRDIAPYKYPRDIAFVDQLPKTKTGKLQRFELRRIAAEEASTGVH